jgi:hypothetical protein
MPGTKFQSSKTRLGFISMSCWNLCLLLAVYYSNVQLVELIAGGIMSVGLREPLAMSELFEKPINGSFNPLKTQFLLNYINSVCTPQETHVTTTKPNQLMLFGETVAVYCENHTEHKNTLCGQNAEFWCVKAGGIYSNHWALKN